MEYSREECLKAVRVIKETCEMTSCFDCPFADQSGVCGFCDCPDNWETIKDEVESNWRVWK